MNVLHVVSGQLSGGAARGALWLHQALLRAEINSRILNNSNPVSSYENVASIALTRKGILLTKLREKLDMLPTFLYRSRSKNLFSTAVAGFDFTKTDHYQWADVVHLHWINRGFVSLKTLGGINKPLVWTMRDMWPMTGGCHVAMECQRYIDGCGKCPQLNSGRLWDLSRWVVFRKSRCISKDVKLVGISNWLSECASKSFLFRDFDVTTISNGINLKEFFPVDKIIARSHLGIDSHKKIVLVGGLDASVYYKGFSKFIEAIKQIKKQNVLFVFFGDIDMETVMNLPIDFLNLGLLHDTVSLRLAYSAADVFVAPSLMDAFGKTLAESLACATPVVCFNATGPKDIVDHKINGYKAVAYNSEDLACGINWVLSDDRRHELLCAKAREKATVAFDIDAIATQYQGLYQSIL